MLVTSIWVQVAESLELYRAKVMRQDKQMHDVIPCRSGLSPGTRDEGNARLPLCPAFSSFFFSHFFLRFSSESKVNRLRFSSTYSHHPLGDTQIHRIVADQLQ